MKAYEHPDLNQVRLTQVMQALSDPCRMTIIKSLLNNQELACNELPVDVAKATLSHHVSVLRDAGLIRTRVEGTKCLNSLRQEAFEEHFPGLLDMLVNCE